MKKYGLILTGGNAPDAEIIRKYEKNSEFTIAADSGFDLALSLDIHPDMVVGDMDSTRNKDALKTVPEENKRVVSHDKDETDTEMALRILTERGDTENLIIGGGGGRIDHLIAILTLFEREAPPRAWITDRETVIHITGTFSFKAEIGERISIFPLGERVRNMRSQGLKWSLDGRSWKRGDMGISNAATAPEVTVSAGSGNLLLILSTGGGRIYV